MDNEKLSKTCHANEKRNEKKRLKTAEPSLYLDAFRVSGVVVGENLGLGHRRVDGGVVLLQIVDRQLEQIGFFQLGISLRGKEQKQKGHQFFGIQSESWTKF